MEMEEGRSEEEKMEETNRADGEWGEVNYALPFWKETSNLLSSLQKNLTAPQDKFCGLLRNPKNELVAWGCCWVWIPLNILYMVVMAVLLCGFATIASVVGFIQSLLFLVVGILVPPTHLVVPVVIGIISFGCCIPASIAVSFLGKPHLPWTKLPHLVKKFWKKYVTDVKAHVDNYGHESGIPQNWNGRIYGLPLDPITIVMSILFYFYALVPVTLGVIFIILIKAIPILLRGIVGYVKCMDFRKATESWAGRIGKYAQFNACEKFANMITDYFKLIKHLNPSMIFEICSGYSIIFENYSGYSIMVSLFWIFGLSVVILFSIFQIVLGFLAWILGLIFTIIGPPILYICSWLALLILVPIVYIFIWIVGMCCTILLPWPFLAITTLLGPILAFKVPYIVFKHNLLNPTGMDQSFKMGLRKPLEIIKDMDKFTGAFSYKKWTLWEHLEVDDTDNIFTTKEIKYWDLFQERSVKEVSEIIDKKWLTANLIKVSDVVAITDLLESMKQLCTSNTTRTGVGLRKLNGRIKKMIKSLRSLFGQLLGIALLLPIVAGFNPRDDFPSIDLTLWREDLKKKCTKSMILYLDDKCQLNATLTATVRSMLPSQARITVNLPDFNGNLALDLLGKISDSVTKTLCIEDCSIYVPREVLVCAERDGTDELDLTLQLIPGASECQDQSIQVPESSLNWLLPVVLVIIAAILFGVFVYKKADKLSRWLQQICPYNHTTVPSDETLKQTD